MTPTRWAWLSAQAAQTAIDSIEFGSPSIGGTVVVQSGAMPSTLPSNQDRVVIVRGSDVAFAEESAPRVEMWTGQGAGALSVVI
jgi:hypothetical protein